MDRLPIIIMSVVTDLQVNDATITEKLTWSKQQQIFKNKQLQHPYV